ncbi:Membrane protein implicated in regulation of membrane protease activity [Haloechinothrix alba]|uniref:Membrane protein implicated in regulation of membrane protease activity n=1 Tax=Haloechinothrix alba TaxID=664784 RepID=A0A238Z5W5_9PSEU|nr:NfeD family protein [Haloechinothrix alba]SNR78582.1 Membrane protein implicated in regulation of membrane protease activity [Haloechinothrix alba]
MGALIWLIVGIALLAAEAMSGSMVLVMLGAGALAAAGSMVLADSVIVSVGVFAVTSIGLLVLARPALKQRFLLDRSVRTNVDALVGARAVTLSTVDAEQGRVKLNGEEWSARCYVSGQVIEPDTPVTVLEISGAMAIVSPGP